MRTGERNTEKTGGGSRRETAAKSRARAEPFAEYSANRALRRRTKAAVKTAGSVEQKSCGIENFKAIVQGDVFECSVAPDMPARIDSRKAGRIGTFRAICEFLGCMGDRSCISTAARMKDEAA